MLDKTDTAKYTDQEKQCHSYHLHATEKAGVLNAFALVRTRE